MNPPQRLRSINVHGHPMSHLALDNPNAVPEQRTDDCECPFPWWLLVLGVAVGGIGGYAIGRQSMKPDLPE